MERGWVKIYRKIQDNPFWDEKPFTKGQAWIDLLLLSNHKDNFFFVRGMKVEVKRGQVGWSEVRLADKWGWSRTKLRGFLKHLENEEQIEQQKNNVSLLITIRNFEEYQGKEQQTRQQKNSRRTAEEQQKDTNKNVKNVKNDKKEPKTFLSDSEELRLVDYFISQIKTNKEDFKDPNKQNWAKTFDLMIRRDKRQVKETAELIKWCQNDSFEMTNVLCPDKLRARYDQLVMKMKKKPSSRGLSRTEKNTAAKEEFLKRHTNEEDAIPCRKLI